MTPNHPDLVWLCVRCQRPTKESEAAWEMVLGKYRTAVCPSCAGTDGKGEKK